MARPERYTVLQKIADGGMAEIYLGLQHGSEGFQRSIVIKRIHTAYSADPQFRNMLIDEAHIAMSLVHSNIVQVLDLGTSEGRDFLVLELVDGWDLHQLVHRAAAAGISLPPELALHILADVCRGLAFAHSRRRDGKPLGIVHRDISPQNILVSEQGEVKLTDFGIATASHKRDKTVAGVVKGKLGFMSPEQASGEPLDHRSDIFAIGTTLYLLATGKKPYVGNTELEVLLRMQQCEFPPPETVKPDLAPELAAIIHKAMQKKPADRYQSAEDLLVDLERVQRTIFLPASQTELKQWLAKLAERDGALATSLRPPPVPPDAHESEIPKGSALVLEEVEPDAMLSTSASVTTAIESPNPPAEADTPAKPGDSAGPALAGAPADSAEPEHSAEPDAALEAKPVGFLPPPTSVLPPQEPLPPPPLPPRPAASPAVVEDPLAVLTTRRSSWLNGFTIVALALALMGAAWLLRPSSFPFTKMGQPKDVLAAFGASRDAGGSPETAKAAPEPAAMVMPAVDVTAEADAGATGPDSEAASADQADGGNQNPSAAAGEDPASSGDKAEVVSVRILSNPPGATVSIMKQSFGSTPLSLRVKPELTYDLVVQKPGFASVTKRVYVSRKKAQTIQINLERRGWMWPF